MSKTLPLSLRICDTKTTKQNIIDVLKREGYEDYSDKIPSNIKIKNAKYYFKESKNHNEWAKTFFDEDVENTSYKAIIFFKIQRRMFILTFGRSYFDIENSLIKIDYEFMRNVALNLLSPDSILEIQSFNMENFNSKNVLAINKNNTVENLNYNKNIDVMKSISGYIDDKDDKNENLGTKISINSGLKLNPEITPSDVTELCKRITTLSKKNNNFGEFNNIYLINDKNEVENLNNSFVQECVEWFSSKQSKITLSDMFNFNSFRFKYGSKISDEYKEITLENIKHFMQEKNIVLKNFSDYKKFVIYQDEIEAKTDSQNKCTLLSVLNYQDNTQQHAEIFFYQNKWYKISKNFLDEVDAYIEKYFKYRPNEFVKYEKKTHGKEEQDPNDPTKIKRKNSEGRYCEIISSNNPNYIHLDKDNIQFASYNKLEICDILEFNNKLFTFHHFKIDNINEKISHLFNQGLNSIKIIRTDLGAREKIQDKINELINIKNIKNNNNQQIEAFDFTKNNYNVNYAIILSNIKKDNNGQPTAKNLTFFSRISLYSILKNYAEINIDVSITFVDGEF